MVGRWYKVLLAKEFVWMEESVALASAGNIAYVCIV